MTALLFPAQPLSLSPSNDNGAEPVILLRPANDAYDAPEMRA